MGKASLVFLLCFIIIASVGVCMAFSDVDLEKYQGGGKAIQRDEPTAAPDTTDKARQSQPNAGDAQSWCEKARQADERVKTAEMNVRTTSSISYSPQAAAAARKELDEAINAKRRIDEEATSQGIPPGWLRCQFE